VSVAGSDTAVVVADSADAAGRARAAQASFERLRERYFPFTFASGGAPCDEVVGRLCTWYGEGEWTPAPEPEEARRLREELLAELDSLQVLIPSEGWILGQRVWYRGEADDWAGGLATARACGAEPWWCSALEGLALHGLRRYSEAELAFDRALEHMDVERARRWLVPERAIDDDARDWLRRMERQSADSLALALDRLWRLADPLYLVEGNDRKSAHYARWTVATLRDGARNPFRLRWGADLEELTVRHGWEAGWERSPSPQLGGPFQITGHKHPEGREYMPSGRTLAAPAAAEPETFLADRRRAKSLHTPWYAPVLLPMDGQLAVFPRGDRMVVVATAFLPEDTSFHAEHDHARPWMEAGEQAGLAPRIGLFALPVDGGPPVERQVGGALGGAVMVDLAAGAYVISAESWNPGERRAGRLRRGVVRDAAPPDVAVLSDLLLLAGARPAPASIAEALPAALLRAELRAGEPLAIAWEVSGLGLRPELFQFEVSVTRTDRNILRRVGELLGLAERPASLALAWEEPGPDRPTHQFRHLDLELPDVEPGRYEITLVLSTAGRSDAITRQALTVLE
jgi:hypothetical protein